MKTNNFVLKSLSSFRFSDNGKSVGRLDEDIPKVYKKELYKNNTSSKRKHLLYFDYLTVSKFKYLNKIIAEQNLDPVNVVGSISINPKEDDEEEQHVEITSQDNVVFNFRLKEQVNNLFTFGYAFLGGNNFVQIRSYLFLPILLFFFMIILIGALAANKFKAIPIVNDLVVANGVSYDGTLRNGESSKGDAGSIEIPGYSHLVLDKSSLEIPLVNPESNDVYFVYTLTTEGKDIYTSDAIAPGQMITFPVDGVLQSGNHTITFTIKCYDVATQAPCNGAVQDVVVTVPE